MHLVSPAQGHKCSLQGHIGKKEICVLNYDVKAYFSSTIQTLRECMYILYIQPNDVKYIQIGPLKVSVGLLRAA